MTPIKLAMALCLFALLSACAAPRVSDYDLPTASLSFSAAPEASEQQATPVLDPMPIPRMALRPTEVRIDQINVAVPETLRVSEANRYLPSGEIVWREDPPGDRRAQVRTIFETALAAGTAEFQGDVPLALNVEVMRFHALTEKARYSVGGVHSIKFALWVQDLRSGARVGEMRIVEADLNALGGRAALEAERRGQTQKVRISAHLGRVIVEELTRADGHRNAELGLIQRLNKF